MSRNMSLDPKSGFVALPLDIMEIEMSPGAFRLLAELCKMANLDGYCWPSLGQLSERLGRSKAALSGYVKELRELDLLQTETQRMANGYNYRLKYLVVFWKKWRERFGKVSRREKPVQKTECSVHSIECKDSKNHNNINQARSERLTKLKLNWENLAKGEQYPAFSDQPSESVLSESKQLVAGLSNAPPISADIGNSFKHHFASRNVLPADEDMEKMLTLLGSLSYLSNPLPVLAKALQSEWSDHWRYPPTVKWTKQFMLKIKNDHPEIGNLMMIQFYLKQYQQWQRRKDCATVETYSRQKERVSIGAIGWRDEASYPRI